MRLLNWVAKKPPANTNPGGPWGGPGCETKHLFPGVEQVFHRELAFNKQVFYRGKCYHCFVFKSNEKLFPYAEWPVHYFSPSLEGSDPFQNVVHLSQLWCLSSPCSWRDSGTGGEAFQFLSAEPLTRLWIAFSFCCTKDIDGCYFCPVHWILEGSLKNNFPVIAASTLPWINLELQPDFLRILPYSYRLFSHSWSFLEHLEMQFQLSIFSDNIRKWITRVFHHCRSSQNIFHPGFDIGVLNQSRGICIF